MTAAHEAPHVALARQTQQEALKHRCPFCHADPGQSCRTHRGRGAEVAWPHSRRIDLSKPRDENAKAVARRIALCCVCGNQRTVSANHFPSTHDPNAMYSEQGKAQGWLRTRTLKCDACGQRTRHAVLRTEGETNWDEIRERIALGDPDTSKYPMGEESIKRLRKEYRELFPRNPYLRHRYWRNEAKAAWTEGHKKVTALCGEEITLKCDPSQPSTKKEEPGRIVADQLSDTEYEDPETGLWWIDIACVDCCRVSNNHHRAQQRERLFTLLAYFAVKEKELIPDGDVGELVEHLEKLFEQAKGDGD